MLLRRKLCGLSMVAVAAALTGCGFRPVFQQGGAAGSASAELAQIKVALIPERTGQLLREELQRRFQGAGGVTRVAYELSTSLTLADDDVGIEFGSTAPSRVRVTGMAQWTLRRLDEQGSTVTSGWAKVTDGYNQIDTQYFYSDLQREQIYRRISAALADQMTLELASYFNKAAKPS